MKRFFDTKTMFRILEQVSDGIQFIDAEGYLTYCNPAAAKLDDISIRDSIGKHITEVYPSLREEESTILQVLRNGVPIFGREQSYYNYKGKPVASVNTTLPVHDAEGRVLGAIEISRDLTEFRALNERVLDLSRRAFEASKTEAKTGRQNRRSAEVSVSEESESRGFQFDDIRTQNAEFLRVKSVAQKAAKTDIPVLIYGETGTGKELLTQSMHNASHRKDEPFIAQNCAALPSTLLEGILFGTVKGGFTGAIDRPGLFELADHGTLFLDEINSMPIELQAKLLRVLQNGQIRRVGDTQERSVDVRIIAATNIDPNKALEQGLIRRDLYYRLNTVTLWIPKLADRREDIPLLTEYFIKKYNQKLYRSIQGVSDAVMSLFLAYPWDGNVRELEHVIEAIANFNTDDRIEIEDLPYNMRQYYAEHIAGKPTPSLKGGLVAAVVDLEHRLIREALAATGGNVTKAAALLEIPRQTLQYKMRELE
ncbi:MAG: sigma 54-interacting transcriptional regulator [Bacillota bacterium]|nr:sigma 54-interacting transcriptional regulator [Bacillota bacterium]